jgi:hypothetical protein
MTQPTQREIDNAIACIKIEMHRTAKFNHHASMIPHEYLETLILAATNQPRQARKTMDSAKICDYCQTPENTSACPRCSKPRLPDELTTIINNLITQAHHAVPFGKNPLLDDAIKNACDVLDILTESLPQ